MLMASDTQGRSMFIPSPEPFEAHGLAWRSKGDVMAWHPDTEQVERWRLTDEGARRVEVWALG